MDRKVLPICGAHCTDLQKIKQLTACQGMLLFRSAVYWYFEVDHEFCLRNLTCVGLFYKALTSNTSPGLLVAE